MSIERAKAIIKNIERTIEKMTTSDGTQPANSMFKMPRARKSDLVKKRIQLKKKYKL